MNVLKPIMLSLLINNATTVGIGEKGIFIIIHGTWAPQSSWYRPGGDFFETLEKAAHSINHNVVPFTWNGKLDHISRLNAAAVLVKLIQSYPPTIRIILVGHSHGGNVAMIASHILATDSNNQHKIEAVFNLGTPVCKKQYMPNMLVIKKVYNLFSLEDMVQPIFGLFDRQYPSHAAIANIRVFFDYCKEPSHKELLSPLIAKWIPFMHEDLAQKKIGNFEQFSFDKAGAIHFYANGFLKYGIDTTRSFDIQRYSKKYNATHDNQKRKLNTFSAYTNVIKNGHMAIK